MVKKKKMTIEELAVRIDTKVDASISDLAIMVQKGFMETAK